MIKQRVLFLCTGNSCRSQMAEGLVNHFLGDRWHAHSAGTEPAGYVHPLAVETMAELGIDISDGESKHADAFRSVHFDAVITVCDDAAEKCPLWLGTGRVQHISFPDPAKATGSREEKMALFRQVRDDIREHVVAALRTFEDDPMTPTKKRNQTDG
ncbi:MAG: arsenate reductase ArsC [Candidatus Promineifilaceae bacterium]|nr:arsenate reductase ArsC [Candidatus Promineifilaceae bacterium]